LLGQNRARLAELTRGPREEQIAATRASVEGARREAEFRTIEYARAKSVFERNLAARDTVDRALPAAPDIVFETDELVSVRELVARGLGVSIVPRSTVEGDGPAVVAIPVGLERPRTVAWRERRQPPAAAAFLSFVRDALVG